MLKNLAQRSTGPLLIDSVGIHSPRTSFLFAHYIFVFFFATVRNFNSSLYLFTVCEVLFSNVC